MLTAVLKKVRLKLLEAGVKFNAKLGKLHSGNLRSEQRRGPKLTAINLLYLAAIKFSAQSSFKSDQCQAFKRF